MSESETRVNESSRWGPDATLQSGPDIIGILCNHRQRQSLRQELDTLGALYGRILRDARLIKELEPVIQEVPHKKVETVIYLIDFDVIRNLIDMNHGTPEQRRHAVQTFELPNFRYAIPIGAFSELVSWFHSLVFRDEVYRASGIGPGATLHDILKRLAAALDVSSDNQNLLELTKEISSAVELLHLSASELLKFLDRPNFLLVYSDVDDSVKSEMKVILQDKARRDNAARENRDENDALNLAVLCKAESLKQADNRLGSFVLLTKTGLLLNLARDLHGDRAAALTRLFCRHEPLAPAGYQVMRPDQAYCVERLREDGRITGNSLKRVERIAGTFRRLAALFLAPDGSFSDLLPELQNQHVRSIERRLKELSRISNDPLYRMIERERRISTPEAPPNPTEPIEIQLELTYKTATELSEKEKLAAREQDEKEKSIATEEFESTKPKLQSLFRILTQLDQKLDEISPTLYESQISPHESGRIQILKVRSHSPEEPVMDGEIFLAQASQHSRPLAYSLAWKTTRPVNHFLNTLENIFSMARDPWKKGAPATLNVARAREDESEPLEGLLVLVRNGAYRASLQEVLRLSLHGGNVIESLTSAISKSSVSAGQHVEIEAIRVQARYGEFQLDILADYLGSREVSVISRFDIGAQVARLCAGTSLLGVFPGRLYDGALKQITGAFSPLTVEVEHAQRDAMRMQ